MAATLFHRIIEPPKGSFFLLGPRGTGKSTWLRTTFPEARVIDLLDEARFQDYLVDAGRFAAELNAFPDGAMVVVDEVQRLPSLLNEVHRHIETRKMRFALCGSSARKLKQAGTNLLAGRAVRRSMYPLLPEELGKAFELERVLRAGSLPVVWSAPEPKEALQAYAQLYLREEIQAEALVRSLPGFARFLPIAGLVHGQVINVAGLARDAGVARSTVVAYLGILEDTLLTFQLPAFTAKLRVRERKHPKFYWADPGLARAMKRQFDPPGAEERGHLFEGWIASVLRAYGDLRELFDDMSYWASGETPSLEVDFILRKGKQLAAVEVKSGKQFTDHDLRGLRAIEKLGGLSRRVLLYLGDRTMKTKDGIEVLPLRAFLDEVETGRLTQGHGALG
jgi:uncharacterized protein